jgi:hypothetical protein
LLLKAGFSHVQVADFEDFECQQTVWK